MSLIGSAEWPLWGTTARLVVTDPARLGAARDLLEDWLDRIELAASRFRDDSEIMNLPAGEWTPVSPMLAVLLERAIHAARISEGLVDPTVGTALVEEGYDRDIELVMAEGRPVRSVVRPVPGWRRLRLEDGRVRVPRGALLDLGATAKAVAADTGAGLVARRFRMGALVSLGGDVSAAGTAPLHGWHVALEDHLGQPDGDLSLFDGGIATSSTQKRTWRVGDRVAHHIIDPRTGVTAVTPYRSVTVVAPTCLLANTFATAAIARGDDAVAWLSAKGVAARCVGVDGTVHRTGRWLDGAAA